MSMWKWGLAAVIGIPAAAVAGLTAWGAYVGQPDVFAKRALERRLPDHAPLIVREIHGVCVTGYAGGVCGEVRVRVGGDTEPRFRPFYVVYSADGIVTAIEGLNTWAADIAEVCRNRI